MAIPYFPMYAADWLSDPSVSSLSFEEQGIFFHLMCRMWQTSKCSLPDDDLKVSRMLKLNHNKWQRIKASLSEVLTYEDGQFFSKRLQAEFKIAEKKSKNNSETAKNREEVKRHKSLESKEHGSTNVPQTDHHKIREDKIREETKDKTLSASLDADAPPECLFYLTAKKRKLTGERLTTFDQFMDAFGDKRGRAQAADSWIDIKPLTRELFEKILVAARKYSDLRKRMIEENQTPKMAQGWLTGRRWEDEPPLFGRDNGNGQTFKSNTGGNRGIIGANAAGTNFLD